MSQDDLPRPDRAMPDRPPARSASQWLRWVSISLLRVTISALEQTAERLEAPDRGTEGSAISTPRSRWAKLQRRVRQRLPISWNRALGDRVLASILIIVLLFPVGILANLWALRPTLPAAAIPAVSRPAQPIKPTPRPFPPERAATPSAAPTLPDRPPDRPSDRPAYGPPLPPARLISDRPVYGPPLPARAVGPLPAVPAVPAAPAPTPEQSFKATILAAMTPIAQPYADSLILAIQPNFRQSRLIMQLSAGWFDLTRSQQDGLANALWHQAQDLNFSQLQLTGQSALTLARSPVVGEAMIVLRPTSPAALSRVPVKMRSPTPLTQQ